MSWSGFYTARCRIPILLLTVLISVVSLQAVTVTVDAPNELDAALTNLGTSQADTILVAGNVTYVLSAATAMPKNYSKLHIIGLNSDPDSFPVIKHGTGDEWYEFLDTVNIYFERLTFESSSYFNCQEPQPHVKSFKQCVIRGSQGESFFRFASAVSTTIQLENCLIVNNNFTRGLFDMNFWSAGPVINIKNCTFDNNTNIFYVNNNIAVTSINITNCIFSNNTSISSGSASFAARITKSFNGNPFYDSDVFEQPSDWKLSDSSPAVGMCDTTGSPIIDIAGNLRGSSEGKYDAGCWAKLLGGKPEITVQPKDSTVAEGAPVSFIVTAIGSEPLRYQWYRNSVLLEKDTLSTLNIPSATISTLKDTIVEFYCRVNNNLDDTVSNVCTLFVVRKPEFSVQPHNIDTIAESSISFTISAFRADGYYWLKGTDSIPGSESNTLNITTKEDMNGNIYRCVAYNIAGKVTSEPAVLSVFGKKPQIVVEPNRVAVLKDSTATFHVFARGADLQYQWYKLGDPTQIGTNNDSLIIPHVSENGRYYCVVKNTLGEDFSDTVQLVVIDETIKNPILINSANFVDRRHVRISLQDFNVLPTAVSSERPYVDTIGIWYEVDRYPTSPLRNVSNFLKISMAEILDGGKSTFEKIIEVNKRECVTYHFVASPFWKNPDLLPAFDTTKGAKVYMCSTVPIVNPLSMKINYSFADSKIDLTISGIDKIKLDSLDYMSVWCTTVDKFISGDTLKPDSLKNPTWTKPYINPLFSGPETTIYFHASLRGILGNFSNEIFDTINVGVPRTLNKVRLWVDSVGATAIKLKWDDPYDRSDLVRIWYDTKAIPENPDTSVKHVIVNAKLDEVLISNLQENSYYYFALQNCISNQYWSVFTNESRTSDKTMNPDDILNTITITDLKFDSLSNKVILKWNLDTIGLSDLKLKTGIYWSLMNETGVPETDLKEIDSTLKTSYADSFDLDRGFQFDSTYYFALWMGYEGKDGLRKWSNPTNSSKRSVKIKYPGWYRIRYFPTADSVVAFDKRIILKPGVNWEIGDVFEDTLLLFKPDITQLKPGMIPVSIGIDFKMNHSTPAYYLSMKCDSIPGGYTMEDVYVYHFDVATGGWRILPRTSFDNSIKTVTIERKPSDGFNSVFMLMIDTQEPQVTILSDTGSIVNARSTIVDSIKVTDNIINSKVKIYLFRNDGVLTQTYIDSADLYDDTIKTFIDANAVTQNNSVFAYVVVSDGRNSKWINISRRVNVEFNNAKLIKDAWSPVFTHSVLNSSAAKDALNEISSADGQWNYDIVKFRIFTWARPNSNDSWVEYSEKDKDLFKFEPGRIMWIKTRKSEAINLGTGYTFPLKGTYSDVTLRAGDYTDFAMPLHFNVVIQDILDSTMHQQEALSQFLGFYSWGKDVANKDRYMAKPLYIPNLVQFNNPRVALMPDSCYSILNSSTIDIKLRVPLIPESMSNNRNPVTPKMLSKTGAEEKWSIAINPTTDEGSLSPVYCGYAFGKSSTRFPVSPSFSKVKVGVLDANDKKLYGILVKHQKTEDGISFPLVFDNGGSETKVVSYGVENWGYLPGNYKVSVFNPETGSYEIMNHNLTVGAGQRDYRYIVVGDEAFLNNWKSSFRSFNFSLLKAYPNPFRSRIKIQFTMPYSGISKMRVAVFDQLGRRLWNKELGRELHPGENIVIWNPSEKGPIATGSYILQLTALDGSGKIKGVKRERLMYMP